LRILEELIVTPPGNTQNIFLSSLGGFSFVYQRTSSVYLEDLLVTPPRRLEDLAINIPSI
jgi:hypothetical protein